MRVIFVRVVLCLALCLSLLCSCGISKTEPVTTGFRCCIQTELDGITVQGVLDRSDDTKSVISFNSPKELEGFRLLCENGTIKLEFNGITFDVPQAYKSETMVISELIEALDLLGAGDGLTDSRFVFDEISGLPISFLPDNNTAAVCFSRWEMTGV